eukprot:gene24428-45184_t
MRLEKRNHTSPAAYVLAPVGAVVFTLIVSALLVLWAAFTASFVLLQLLPALALLIAYALLTTKVSKPSFLQSKQSTEG